MLKIVNAPDPVLSDTAKRIIKVDKPIKKLITEMADTLDNAKDPEGVGLAAPQIRKSLQLFIVRQTKKSPLLTFINPIIHEPLNEISEDKKAKKKTKKPARNASVAGGKSIKLEGCLSLQDIWGIVKRHPSVVLEYTDEKGKTHKEKFTGFLATIIQHEVDHLHGILFPKRVIEQKGQLYKSSKDKKGETVFEELTI